MNTPKNLEQAYHEAQFSTKQALEAAKYQAQGLRRLAGFLDEMSKAIEQLHLIMEQEKNTERLNDGIQLR